MDKKKKYKLITDMIGVQHSVEEMAILSDELVIRPYYYLRVNLDRQLEDLDRQQNVKEKCMKPEKSIGHNLHFGHALHFDNDVHYFHDEIKITYVELSMDDKHEPKFDEFGFKALEWKLLKLVATKYFETSKDAKEVFRDLQLDRSKIDLLGENGNVTYERINFDYSKRYGDVLAELGIITNRTLCERAIKTILLSSPEIPDSLKTKIEEAMKSDKGLFKIAAEIKHYYGVREAMINRYPNSFVCFMRDDRKNNDADAKFIEKALDKDKLNLQYVLEDKKAKKPAGVQEVKYLKQCISEDITLFYKWVVCPYLEDLENLEKDEKVKKVNPDAYNHGYNHWSKYDDAWRATAVRLLFRGNWLSEAVKGDENVANILECMFKKLANRPEFVEFCEEIRAGEVLLTENVTKIMEEHGVELTSGTTID